MSLQYRHFRSLYGNNPEHEYDTAMVISSEESTGREIKVYDDVRQPREWTALLTSSQCAVFFKRINSETPLFPDGTVARFRDSTFLLFNSIEAARQLCESRVRECPNMCCEIFDWKGKSQAPLLTILHPGVTGKDELSEESVRKRKIAAIILFFAAAPLFWWDQRSGGLLVLPTFLGLTIIVIGLRVLHWNMARGEGLKAQEQRMRSHLQREQEALHGGKCGNLE
jgi:hypothetical protein